MKNREKNNKKLKKYLVQNIKFVRHLLLNFSKQNLLTNCVKWKKHKLKLINKI